MTVYHLVKTMADGVVGMRSVYGYQLFTRCKLRKPKKCAECGVDLRKGEEAFSPLTNAMNRMHRLCVPCVPSRPVS